VDAQVAAFGEVLAQSSGGSTATPSRDHGALPVAFQVGAAYTRWGASASSSRPMPATPGRARRWRPCPHSSRASTVTTGPCRRDVARHRLVQRDRARVVRGPLRAALRQRLASMAGYYLNPVTASSPFRAQARGQGRCGRCRRWRPVGSQGVGRLPRSTGLRCARAGPARDRCARSRREAGRR